MCHKVIYSSPIQDTGSVLGVGPTSRCCLTQNSELTFIIFCSHGYKDVRLRLFREPDTLNWKSLDTRVPVNNLVKYINTPECIK